MRPCNIVIKEKVLQKDMYYKDQLVLSYTIKYPQFISDRFQLLFSKLNIFYRTKALMYEKSNITSLYQMAMVEYEYSIANDFPIRTFEAFTDYNVTYNQECAVSLYFDQYEYAGGAHGLTVRTSDTWCLPKSRRLELREFFPYQYNYREYIVNEITRQIAEQIAEGNNIYFENYSQLVNENFQTNSFYFTEEGVIIYFQSYDIAPYARGLPTFTIPYSVDGANPPRCV